MIGPADSDPDLGLAREAVAAAGALALEHFGSGTRRWYKGPGQVVTEADIAVDALLYEMLVGARPHHGWLSEERVDDRSRLERARVWMVDPIDGTRAFADGIPEFAISVALVEAGQAVLGLISNPATGELFEATRGGGAWLNRKPLAASMCTDLAEAALLSSRGEMTRRRWPELIPEASFTTVGSLAYKLALIASGRFDGLISLRASHDWDLAAALLLLREAGGCLSDAAGAPVVLNRDPPRHAGLAAAGTGRLHEAMLARLRACSRAG